jgi:hypothetical protein
VVRVVRWNSRYPDRRRGPSDAGWSVWSGVLRVVERLEEKSRAEGVSLPLSWSLEEDLG